VERVHVLLRAVQAVAAVVAELVELDPRTLTRCNHRLRQQLAHWLAGVTVVTVAAVIQEQVVLEQPLEQAVLAEQEPREVMQTVAEVAEVAVLVLQEAPAGPPLRMLRLVLLVLVVLAHQAALQSQATAL
jgi:hypothetical protein